MNKRYLHLGLTVTLLGLVVGSLSLTAGAAPNGVKVKSWHDNPLNSRAVAVPASHEGGQTLAVTTTETNSRGVDVEGDGEGPGDYFVFREKVFNEDGVRVGRDNGQCTINFPANETAFSVNCAVAVTFTGAGGIDRGMIMVEGNIQFTDETSLVPPFPITGGSGHYQNVRGELHPGGEQGDGLVFHLLP